MKGFLDAKAIAAAALLVTAASQAQFLDRMSNPKVLVSIQHRPVYTLNVSRIAVHLESDKNRFGGFGMGFDEGECAEAWLASTISGFLSRSIEVVDRNRLARILEEHKLASSGLMNQETAAKIGQLVGAQVFVFLKPLSCRGVIEENRRPFVVRGVMVTPPDFVATLTISATVQAIDLTSGRVIAARNLQSSGSAVWRDKNGDVRSLIQPASENAAAEVMKLFFPWEEQREVVFYDDKDCNLKTAFLLIQGGDLDGALAVSEQNIETCRALGEKAKKAMWRSLHNVGILLFATGRYSEALARFQEAMSLGGGEIVAEAMAECRRAEKAQAELQEYVAKFEAERAASAAAPSKQAASGGAVPKGGGRPSGSSAPSVEERLRRVDQMCKQGLLTKEECQQKRQEILRDL